MNDFFDMGGYALYVWGSFGATLAVFAWNVLAPRRERARLLRALREDAGVAP
jgi:heme exporter protein CcmD